MTAMLPRVRGVRGDVRASCKVRQLDVFLPLRVELALQGAQLDVKSLKSGDAVDIFLIQLRDCEPKAPDRLFAKHVELSDLCDVFAELAHGLVAAPLTFGK